MPRVKRVAHKSSSATQDAAPKFVSREAEARYKAILTDKTLIGERGFVPEDIEKKAYPAYLLSVIQQRKWELLCEQPFEVVTPVVREFCANFLGDNPFVVTVRGIQVAMGPNAIRDDYNLEETTNEYAELLKRSNNRKLLQQVVKRLCEEGTQWDISNQKAYTFKRNSLKPEAKVWYTFLQSRLLPTMHFQTVSRDRAFLLFCILEGKPIDVSAIIYQELSACLQQTTGNFYFPALVTELCKNAGIIIKKADERLKLPAAIRPASVERMTSRKGTPSKKKGATSRPFTATSHISEPEVDNASMAQQVADLQRQLADMLNQQKIVWRYMAERDEVVNANFQSQFQKFQSLPKFPSAVLEQEETGDDEAEPSQRRKGKSPVVDIEDDTEEEDDADNMSED